MRCRDLEQQCVFFLAHNLLQDLNCTKTIVPGLRAFGSLLFLTKCGANVHDDDVHCYKKALYQIFYCEVGLKYEHFILYKFIIRNRFDIIFFFASLVLLYFFCTYTLSPLHFNSHIISSECFRVDSYIFHPIGRPFLLISPRCVPVTLLFTFSTT